MAITTIGLVDITADALVNDMGQALASADRFSAGHCTLHHVWQRMGTGA